MRQAAIITAVAAAAILLTAAGTAYAQGFDWKAAHDALFAQYNELSGKYTDSLNTISGLKLTAETQAKLAESNRDLADHWEALYRDHYNNSTQTIRDLNWEIEQLRNNGGNTADPAAMQAWRTR